MNEQCSDKNESNLAFVERLSSIVARLTLVVDRMATNETIENLNAAETESLADIELSSQEALRVSNERSQLVEAWKALEAEQRRQALEQSGATRRPTSANNETKPMPLNNSPNSLDRTTQFRLVQRELDRPGNQ